MTEKREATVTEDFIFGEWMLDEMEAQGISVVQLSELSTITVPGIRNLLYDKRRPRIDTLYRITKALGKKIVFMDDDEIISEKSKSAE